MTIYLDNKIFCLVHLIYGKHFIITDHVQFVPHYYTLTFYQLLIFLFSFVFSVCLRLQANPQNKAQFSDISPERGFADFIFAHIVLHLTIINFIG